MDYETLPEVIKLRRRIERLRTECVERQGRINDDNKADLTAEIEYRERAIKESEEQIVQIIDQKQREPHLIEARKRNTSKFRRRREEGKLRKTHCYHCDEILSEGVENFCANCGYIKCSRGHCGCETPFGVRLPPLT